MARLAIVVALSALLACACSVGLPDNLDGYGNQTGRADAIAAAPSTPTLAPHDGGIDGSADAAPVNVAPGDASADAAPPCMPQKPAQPFAPAPWAPSTPLHQRQCSAAQAQMVTSCLMTTVGATPSCNQFMTAYPNGPCIQCALTSVNAPRRGPILDDGQNYFTNPAGCIAALSGDESAQGCGAQFDALGQCENAVCGASCSSTQANYASCSAEADKTTCSAYAPSLTCSQPYASQCEGSSPADEALKLVTLFCVD